MEMNLIFYAVYMSDNLLVQIALHRVPNEQSLDAKHLVISNKSGKKKKQKHSYTIRTFNTSKCITHNSKNK